MIHPEVDWLRKWAGYRPDKVALRDHGRGLQWTYAEAERRATALAGHLQGAFGVARGDRVAVLVTGHGLKDPGAALGACRMPVPIPPLA